MNKKGFFFMGMGAGMIVGIAIGIILFAAAVYIFLPEFLPESPCLVNENCNEHKLCCTYRCDSKTVDWWNCPDKLCEFLGKEKPTGSCGCTKPEKLEDVTNLKCRYQ